VNVTCVTPLGEGGGLDLVVLLEVIRTGWLGHELGGPELSFASSTAEALPWLAWLAIATAVTKRYFRWEPRQA
jgi:hypothetical protein